MPVTGYADDIDEYQKKFLTDGASWTNTILDSLESANWHEALSAFEKLFVLLPEVYTELVKTNPELAQKLEDSTERWDHYF